MKLFRVGAAQNIPLDTSGVVSFLQFFANRIFKMSNTSSLTNTGVSVQNVALKRKPLGIRHDADVIRMITYPRRNKGASKM